MGVGIGLLIILFLQAGFIWLALLKRQRFAPVLFFMGIGLGLIEAVTLRLGIEFVYSWPGLNLNPYFMMFLSAMLIIAGLIGIIVDFSNKYL